MGVNFFVDKAATQEMNVALTQGLLSEASKQIEDQTGEKKQADRAEERSHASQLADSKKSENKLSRQLVADLASKVAQSGIKLADGISNKMDRRLKDEYDLMLDSGQESVEDAADLSRQFLATARTKNQSRQNQQQQQEQNSGLDPALKDTVKEYKSAYIQMLVNGGSEIKKKLQELEGKMREQGLSLKDLESLQATLKKSIRSEIAAQIKDQYLKKLMSGEKDIDKVINTRALNDVLDFACTSKELGEWDFGGFMENLQGVMDGKADEVHREVRSFVQDDLETMMLEKHASKNNPDFNAEKAEKQFKDLLELGMKAGFKPEEFLANWQSKSDHLFGFIPQQLAGAISSGLNQEKDKRQTGFEYSEEDEKEMLLNQLRALYMRRAIKGDLVTSMETSFKIRKLKNGLIKLGVSFEEFEKVEKEGGAIAKLRALEMLKEFLAERATLYELAGPAYDLINRKIKSALKNLDRLGSNLSDLEFDNLQDEANIRMFEVARFELDNTIVLYEGTKDPGLEKKIMLIIKLMKRLKEETQIPTDFDPELRFAQISQAA